MKMTTKIVTKYDELRTHSNLENFIVLELSNMGNPMFSIAVNGITLNADQNMIVYAIGDSKEFTADEKIIKEYRGNNPLYEINIKRIK